MHLYKNKHVILLFGINLNNLTDKKNITQLQIGESALITAFADGQIAAKLMAMGLLPGTTLALLHKAPFGGAYYIKINNHYLALRVNEAKNVLITSAS